jgi:molybdenum cofactor biosynthesis enzyme
MVPIALKPVTLRTAVAVCSVYFSNAVPAHLICTHAVKKGDVLAVARIAGIMAAKKTSEFVPLCHPIGIEGVEVDVAIESVDEAGNEIELPIEEIPSSNQHGQKAPSEDEMQEGGESFIPLQAMEEEEDVYPFHTVPKALEARGKFGRVTIKATVKCTGKTGVEMEALTAASGAALTVYDMCKAVDKGMRIEGLRVIRKEGGRSGRWVEGVKGGSVKDERRAKAVKKDGALRQGKDLDS